MLGTTHPVVSNTRRFTHSGSTEFTPTIKLEPPKTDKGKFGLRGNSIICIEREQTPASHKGQKQAQVSYRKRIINLNTLGKKRSKSVVVLEEP